MDSTQQEPPGVCSMSRSSLSRKCRAPGDSASSFVCWLEWFPWQSMTTEDNPSGQRTGGVSRDHRSTLLNSTWHRQTFLMALQVSPCLQSGWSRSWEAMFAKSPTPRRTRPGICQMWRWESVEVKGIYYFTINFIDTFLCPDLILLYFSCTNTTTSWTDLLTTDRRHWFYSFKSILFSWKMNSSHDIHFKCLCLWWH